MTVVGSIEDIANEQFRYRWRETVDDAAMECPIAQNRALKGRQRDEKVVVYGINRRTIQINQQARGRRKDKESGIKQRKGGEFKIEQGMRILMLVSLFRD